MTMTSLTLDDRHILNKKYPILQNFPFGEFSLQVGELPNAPVIETALETEPAKKNKYDSPIIRFTTGDKYTFMINIHENDMMWVFERAEVMTEIDSTVQIMNSALESDEILVKRDAVEIGEAWIKKLADNKTMLTYSTFTEVLATLLMNKTILDATRLINNINKLSNKQGLVKLDKDEYQIIMTYYQFRLVYTKLILGLVIAAKISV